MSFGATANSNVFGAMRILKAPETFGRAEGNKYGEFADNFRYYFISDIPQKGRNADSSVLHSTIDSTNNFLVLHGAREC